LLTRFAVSYPVVRVVNIRDVNELGLRKVPRKSRYLLAKSRVGDTGLGLGLGILDFSDHIC